ncbi:MAG: lyase family protein, partial [Bombilactobacillus sp.]
QVLPRDLHAEYIMTLALIAASVERFALEIRHLQRTEVREVEEFFAPGQKGSSAMPHKRNPIGSENVTGLARVIKGHVFTALENIELWHERDISHSSAERIILPDTTEILDYMLHRFTKIVQNLTVFPQKMEADLQITHGLIYSQRVMLKLIKTGLSRETAYDIVQPLTAQVWEQKCDFRQLLEADPRIQQHLSKADLDDAFDYHWHLRHVDEIFQRVGLSS